MRYLFFLLVLLLGFGVGALFVIDVPAPQKRVEEPIPAERWQE